MSNTWMLVASSQPKLRQNHHQSFAGSASTMTSCEAYTWAHEDVMWSTSISESSLIIWMVMIVVKPRPALSALAENSSQSPELIGCWNKPSSPTS